MVAKKSSRKSASAKTAATRKLNPVSLARKVESAGDETRRTAEKIMRDTTATATNTYSQAYSTAKEKISQAGSQMFSGYGDVAQMSKSNMEAMVKCSQILAKSTEQLGRAIAGFTQSSFEMSAQAGQAMLGVRTLRDFVDVQNEYARNSFDHFIAGTSKISDMAMKVTNEAIEPLSQQVSGAVAKASRKFAA